jgi:predicted NAD/FAD-binding protein
MGSAFDHASRRDAKEYARFCRIHGFFLVDGLERWQTVLKDRGLSEIEITAKVAAATALIKSLAEPWSERHGA